MKIIDNNWRVIETTTQPYGDCISRQAVPEQKWIPCTVPEQKWIPCAERLPEANRLVLCYVTTGASETYFLAFWNDNLNAWEEGIGGIRLLENDLGYEVIAWMPLPKPYKAESEDKE